MTLPEKFWLPPSPNLSIVPVVMADAVASRTTPVSIVSEVNFATLPPVPVNSIPNAWKEADVVAVPPTATSREVINGEMTSPANCHLLAPAPVPGQDVQDGTPEAPVPDIKQRDPVSVSATLVTTPPVSVYKTALASVPMPERIKLESESVVTKTSPVPPGVKVNAPVTVKVVDAPEKEISVSATAKSLKVFAPVNICVPAKEARVPVIAGSVTVVISSETSAAVNSSSLVSFVVPSNQIELPSSPAVSVNAAPVNMSPTAVISPVAPPAIAASRSSNTS